MDTKAHAVPVQPMAPHPNGIAAHRDLEKRRVSENFEESTPKHGSYYTLLLLIQFLYMIVKYNNLYGDIISCSDTFVSY